MPEFCAELQYDKETSFNYEERFPMKKPWQLLSLIFFIVVTLNCKQRESSAPTDSAVASARSKDFLQREFRGAWISTVSNIDWPSRSGLSAEIQKKELIQFLDRLKQYHINVALLQVRPEGDSFYESKFEPWSRYLTGTQGKSPGYDPLAFFVEEAHKRGIEAHAWINPYRAKSNASVATAKNHVSITHPDYVYTSKNLSWMDPGAKSIQDLTYNVVIDIVSRYDIDGLHMDDYFYPYPSFGEFPDSKSYEIYKKAGGTLERADWRRDNVNKMVERLYKGIKAKKPWVDFGISPFGIYKNGVPEGVKGLDQYNAIFADPKLWIEKKWVDYVAPQLYWPIAAKNTPFEKLLLWWASLSSDRPVMPGVASYKINEKEGAYPVSEIINQIAITQKHRAKNVGGAIFFQSKNIVRNDKGLADELLKLYKVPVLAPSNAYNNEAPPIAPVSAVDGNTVKLTHEAVESLRFWVLYYSEGKMKEIYSSQQSEIKSETGSYKLTAVNKMGLESEAISFEVK